MTLRSAIDGSYPWLYGAVSVVLVWLVLDSAASRLTVRGALEIGTLATCWCATLGAFYLGRSTVHAERLERCWRCGEHRR